MKSLVKWEIESTWSRVKNELMAISSYLTFMTMPITTIGRRLLSIAGCSQKCAETKILVYTTLLTHKLARITSLILS